MNTKNSLFDLLGTISRQRFAMAERHFAKLGLNHTEARCLSLLSRAGGTATQEVLAGEMFIDRSNVGRALRTLEDQQYILRCKGMADKRANLVTITPKGEEMVGKIREVGESMAQAFFGGLTDEQIKETEKLLSIIANNEALKS